MFSSGPSYNKLKTNLKLAISRLKLREKQKTEMALKQRKEIADYISGGKVDRAKIRVEHIIREDYLVEAMEILEMFCDLLLARFGLIQQMKTLDDGLAEAISSIIWITPRLQSDVQELKIISEQFASKYGKPYAMSCLGNEIGTVSEKLMHKMSVQAPPKVTVEKYMIEIAKYYNVEYQPDTQILSGDECYAADQLIDLGPAPPLPDKNEFNGGGNSSGGNAAPGIPAAQPFQYPQQQPPAPFQYPTQPLPYPQEPYPQGGAGIQPYPQGATGGYPAPAMPPFNAEKSVPEDGPPPYFPPDVSSPPSAHQPSVTAAPAAASLKTEEPSKSIPDLPELPGVPDDTPSFEDRPNIGSESTEKGNNDDGIDFDDLTRRFEALKKKK